MNSATAGEVLELSGPCPTNVTVTNKHAFTLRGGAGAVLSPNVSGTPIIGATAEEVHFTLEGLTFEDGKAVSGGAVHVASSEEAVALRNDVFLSNKATSTGGAVAIEDEEEPASEATVLEGNTFGAPGEGNATEAGGYSGGGARLRVGGPVQVIRNSFIDNEVANQFGGGGGLDFENYGGAVGPIRVSNNTFTGNRVTDAGGGAFIGAGAAQAVTLEGNLFSANRVAGKEAFDAREGGGLVLAVTYKGGGAFHAVQAHNTFAGNVVEATEKAGEIIAAGGGGEWVLGVSVQSTADVFRENRVTVGEGLPPEGGGLGVLGSSKKETTPAPASFTGSDDLFVGNSVAPGGWGGGIYTGFQNAGCSSECEGTTLSLKDSTVYGNEVKAGAGSQGGALWGSPTDSLTLENSIIAGNAPAPQIFGYGTGAAAPSFLYSDVCPEAGGPAVPVGLGDICANPHLEAGGQETLASPTIDVGSNALVPIGLGTDLAGTPRILATRLTCTGLGVAIVDMGAFESQLEGPVLPCIPVKTVITPTPPVIGGASESHRSWREGTLLASISSHHKRPPLGTTFSFTLNEAASIRFAFTQQVGGRKVHGRCVAPSRSNRHRHACKRTVTPGVLSFAAHAGSNKVSFQGRLSHSKKLRPGTYTLVITATNSAGQRSAPRSLTFTIVK